MAKGVLTTKDRSIAVVRVQELWVAATGNNAITDASWEEYLNFAGESIKAEGPFHGLLLWWPQAAPTAAQRVMLVEKYADAVRLDQQRRAAVVAESLIIRGAMTAIGWFSKGETIVKPFSPTDPKVPLDWLAEDCKFDRAEAESARVRAIESCW